MPPPTPRRNPSHALHPPVPVQTSPWLSSPLLRYVTCMPTTGRSQIRISMDTFSCEPDSSLMCSEQHDQHLTNRPLIYSLWVPSTTWDWIAFLCWPGNPEGCYFADVGTSLECRNYLQSGLRPCFLHKTHIFLVGSLCLSSSSIKEDTQLIRYIMILRTTTRLKSYQSTWSRITPACAQCFV